MHAAPFMGSKNSHPASRERAVKSAIKTVSIIFTYSSGQTGNSTGKENILGDLSVSCGGGVFPITSSQTWSKTAGVLSEQHQADVNL